MIKATRTLELINDAIECDQGGAYRQALGRLLPKMEDAYRGQEKTYRGHMGASMLGRECARELWYGFRWARRSRLGGRLLRLFNRGHLEEARFLAMLEVAGINIWYETEDGGQFKFQGWNGHYGSALDGVVNNLPELPDGTATLCEFKTSSDKIFQKVAKNGMQNEKYEHYVQMQVCMREMGLTHGFYMMVNKNNDDLHAEIITYDAAVADQYHQRAGLLIYAQDAPPKIHPSPGWWQCKFCDFAGVCKGVAEVPQVNCRTCVFSSPSQENKTWTCAKGQTDIINGSPETGCVAHVYNPAILNIAKLHGYAASMEASDIELHSGERLLQGPNHVTSEQLRERGLA